MGGYTLYASPSPSENLQIWRWLRLGESGGFSQPVGGGMEANAVAKRTPVTPHFEAVGITCKPKKAARLPQEPHSPSESPRYFAAITLQCADESIIVGYYTSAEVHPQKLPASQPPLWGEKGVLWQEATVSIVPAQEI